MRTRRGYSTLTDEDLLTRSAAEPDAFAEFYDRHALRLTAMLRKRVGSTDIALDLAAETFAVVLERSADFEPHGDGSAAAWTYTIARNQLTDLYRRGSADDRARRRLQMRPVTMTDDAIERVERRLDAANASLTGALAELPDHEREAIGARILDEQDYDEIARRLDVSESVVRQRVHRGLRRLRSKLGAQR